MNQSEKLFICCLFLFLLFSEVDIFGQTPVLLPMNIDFGFVKVGEYRDTSITGIFYPGDSHNGQKRATLSLEGDTIDFSIDKNSMYLYYSSTIGISDTVHLRFSPKKEGSFQGFIRATIDGGNSSGSPFHGISKDSVTFSVASNSKYFSIPIIFPNPVSTSATLSFTLPQSQFTSLKIYNALGNEVATLINQRLPAGDQKVEFNASHLPSGVYYYRLQIGDHLESKPMIVAH